MTDDEYTGTQTHLVLAANLLAGLDLAAFVERIDHTGAVAPILDPTLYMRGAGTLQAVRGLAVAGIRVQEAKAKLDEAARERDRREAARRAHGLSA